MVSAKFTLLLSTVFLLSCGDTVRNKKKGKNRMLNGVKTLKQAKSLHRDPCDEQGACQEMVKLDYKKAGDETKYPQYINKDGKTDRDYQPGDTTTHSVLKFINSFEESSKGPAAKYCFVMYDLTKVFYEYQYQVQDGEDIIDIAVFKHEISNWRPLMEDDFCKKEIKKHYEFLMEEDIAWDWDDVTVTTNDNESEEEGETGESDTEVEIKTTEIEEVGIHGLKYKSQYAVRSQVKVKSYIENKKTPKSIDDYLIMYYSNDFTDSGKIFSRIDLKNGNGTPNYYESELLKSTSKRQINPKDVPADVINF